MRLVPRSVKVAQNCKKKKLADNIWLGSNALKMFVSMAISFPTLLQLVPLENGAEKKEGAALG